MKSIAWSFVALFAAVLFTACGPSASGDGDDDGDDDVTGVDSGACVPTGSESGACGDVTDNDCNGLADCDDSACTGSPDCPSADCGEIQHPEAALALPDGEDDPAYTSSINFTGFSDGQLLTDPSKLLAVCVNMEHTWLRDLQIEIICPTGNTVALQMFLGQTGSEIFMGEPIDYDDPIGTPGVGYEYCWSPTAANAPMLDYATANSVHDLPAGDYRPAGTWNTLQDCPLNGDWTMRVDDLWASDNGFIFSWGMKFDSSIIDDCEGWPPIG